MHISTNDVLLGSACFKTLYKCHILYVSLCNFFGCFCSILYFWDVSILRPLSLIHSFTLLCSIPLHVNIIVLICVPGDKHLQWGNRVTLSTRDFQEADTKMGSDVKRWIGETQVSDVGRGGGVGRDSLQTTMQVWHRKGEWEGRRTESGRFLTSVALSKSQLGQQGVLKQRLSIIGTHWEARMAPSSSSTAAVSSHWLEAIQMKCHTGSEGVAAGASVS